MLIKSVIKPGSRRFIVVILQLIKKIHAEHIRLVINLLCVNENRGQNKRVNIKEPKKTSYEQKPDSFNLFFLSNLSN